MSKNKSLGHNPLAHRHVRYANFDFIKSVQEPEKTTLESEKSVSKTNACYYLEEPIINKIRIIAKEKDTSYSALVNEMLKYQLAEF